MKYSRKLHGALILAAFALLFAVIGSAYCQIDPVTWEQWRNGKHSSQDTLRVETLKTDTIPTPVWNTIALDSATAKWYYGTGTIGAEKSVYIVSRNDTVWAQSDTGNVLLWPVVDVLIPIPHEINNGGDEMKHSKYKALTVAQFREMLDEFFAEPEEALSVTYFKIRVKRQYSTGQRESLRLDGKQ